MLECLMSKVCALPDHVAQLDDGVELVLVPVMHGQATCRIRMAAPSWPLSARPSMLQLIVSLTPLSLYAEFHGVQGPGCRLGTKSALGPCRRFVTRRAARWCGLRHGINRKDT